MAGKRLTKAQVISEVAGATDLDKKSVSRVFEALSDIIRKQLSARGRTMVLSNSSVKMKATSKC